jgi:carboxypeptidase C (cathepsin A)
MNGIRHYKSMATALLVSIAIVSAAPTIVVAQEPAQFISEHRIEAGGRLVLFTATAGETLLRDDSSRPIAAIWSVAYTASNAERDRPVVFVFSGGPGAASLGLNIGFLGPRLVPHSSSPSNDGGVASFELIDNPHSLLDIADFIFVDPVGTGFSRAIGDAENKDFWSMAADTASMADFIRTWITENQRSNSPKYILGLSYGTPRAVTIARRLSQSSNQMTVNGLMLLGPALDFMGLDPIVGNPISYISFMPTQAAVAHYHGKVGRDVPLEEFLSQARQFAIGDYFQALVLGNKLSRTERLAVARKLSTFIGLDPELILNANLRVSIAKFRSELLRDSGMTIGYSDGRYTGPALDPNSAKPTDGDPSVTVYDARYEAGVNHHHSKYLGIRIDRPYRMWNTDVGRDWAWSPDLSVFKNPQAYRQAKRGGHIEVASQLASVMQKNAELEVQVAVGYYDLYTPFFDTERVFANFNIDPDRVEMNYYTTGHRLYTNSTVREALTADIRDYLSKEKQ